MSNVTTIQVFDASNTQIRLSTKQYNSKNLLYKDLTALNYANTYTYDANGNVTTVADATNKTVVLSYDALNRVSSQTSPDLGVTNYTYNPDDSIASIKDATNATTQYKYNGFGELISVVSPDTGTNNITRDLSGSITNKVDAKGISVNYTYDLLHRPVTVTYPNSAENVTITYDSCANGVGKVCTVADISGLTTYTYDGFGQLESKTYTAGAFTKSIHYAYDNVGRLNKITYPSGMEVNYGYANNKPVSISYTVNGGTNNVITNGVYDPFSSEIKSYQYGNGASYSKTFNQDGLISSINSGIYGFSQSYNFDSRLNISGITGTTSASVTYDDNSRITNFNNIIYNYNKNGNRTSVNNNGTSYAYSNASNSNRLNGVNGYVFGYDAIGNQISDNAKLFGYNNAGALVTYSDGANNYSYLVNSGMQRVKKSDNNDATNNIWFVYDANGQVISEHDESGAVINEYIYLNGVPVGLVKAGSLYNIYPDHLGTPRVVTNSNNGVVWKWDNTDAFGANVPSVATIEFNLRFAGQYFDKESNLHYNYHRTYNPKTGRYIQSDPLGLAAGNNTYGYVDGNSLSEIDPTGNIPLLIPFIVGGAIGGITNGLNYYSQGESVGKGFFNGFIIGGATAALLPLITPNVIIGGAVGGAGTQLLNRYKDNVKIFDTGHPVMDCGKEILLTGAIGGLFGKTFDSLADGITGGSTNSFIIKHVDTFKTAVTNAYSTSYTNIVNAYTNLGTVLH
jgi:RHS repeat-associated protein